MQAGVFYSLQKTLVRHAIENEGFVEITLFGQTGLIVREARQLCDFVCRHVCKAAHLCPKLFSQSDEVTSDPRIRRAKGNDLIAVECRGFNRCGEK